MSPLFTTWVSAILAYHITFNDMPPAAFFNQNDTQTEITLMNQARETKTPIR